MKIFLLGLKILGIVTSGAAFIGSERLKTTENKIRVFLETKEINLLLENIRKFLMSPFASLPLKQKEIGQRISQVSLNFSSSAEELYKSSVRHLYGYQNSQKPLSRWFLLAARIIFLPIQLVLIIIYYLLYTVIVTLIKVLLAIVTLLVSALFFIIIFLSHFIDILILLLIMILSTIAWAVTRPYVWLDIAVQKQKIESTIGFIGIIISIIAEIVGSIYY